MSPRRGIVTLVIGLALGATLGEWAGSVALSARAQEDHLSLDEWRQQRQDFLAAFRETDPGTRVELLEKFLRTHPDAAERLSALQMLATSMLATGACDPGRVEAVLKELVTSPAVSCYSIKSVLQTYVDHPELSLPGARFALQRADAMLVRDRQESERLNSKSRRLGELRFLEACRQSILALHGKMLLVRGEVAEALPFLKEAERQGVRLGIDLLAVDEKGRIGGAFPTGRLDDLRLSLALASERSGDFQTAHRELSQVLGSQLSEAQREQAHDLRARLGIELDRSVEVRAPLTRAPEMTLADLSGRKHSLRDYRGRVVVLNFWSTT